MISNFPSPQQHGFQKQFSCITEAFALQEIIYYNIECQCNVYVAFLDQKAAFDCINHDRLFVKIGRLGIKGKSLRILQTSYENLKCIIRTCNTTSDVIDVRRGVRQGGVLSTFYYLAYIDELLQLLESSGYGAKLESLPCGNPTFADDLTLIGVTPYNLQKLTDIVYRYCITWDMQINVKKSNVVVFSSRRNPPTLSILYGNDYIEQTKSAEHLGISQESNLKLNNRIEQRIQKGKNAFYALAGHGIHPQGVNPLVSCELYKKVVMPTVLYGAELWNNLTQTDISKINIFQHFIPKKIQGFPISVRSDIAESMLGLYRLSSAVEKQKMMFLHKILSLPPECITKQIFLRKYYMYLVNKSSVSYGFIPDICNVLKKYNLVTILNSFIADSHTLPKKCTWKNIVSNAITLGESILWNQRTSADNDFLFFRILHPVIQPCIIYKVFKESCRRHTMTTIAYLWCRGARIENGICRLCGSETFEELIHLLSQCTQTQQLRECLSTELRDSLGRAFTADFSTLDNYAWTLKLLGSPIAPNLGVDGEKQYLATSYRYIIDCLKRL